MSCWWCHDRALRLREEMEEAMRPLREIPTQEDVNRELREDQCRRQMIVCVAAFAVVDNPVPEKIVELDKALDQLRYADVATKDGKVGTDASR